MSDDQTKAAPAVVQQRFVLPCALCGAGPAPEPASHCWWCGELIMAGSVESTDSKSQKTESNLENATTQSEERESHPSRPSTEMEKECATRVLPTDALAATSGSVTAQAPGQNEYALTIAERAWYREYCQKVTRGSLIHQSPAPSRSCEYPMPARLHLSPCGEGESSSPAAIEGKILGPPQSVSEHEAILTLKLSREDFQKVASGRLLRSWQNDPDQRPGEQPKS